MSLWAMSWKVVRKPGVQFEILMNFQRWSPMRMRRTRWVRRRPHPVERSQSQISWPKVLCFRMPHRHHRALRIPTMARRERRPTSIS